MNCVRFMHSRYYVTQIVALCQPYVNPVSRQVRFPKHLRRIASTTNISRMSTHPSNPPGPTQSPLSRREALVLGATVAADLALAPGVIAQASRRKVVVWSEGTANVDPKSKIVYPNDINSAIAEGLEPLKEQGWQIVKASLNDPDQGISDELLNTTDVLIWWGHKKHGEVKDSLVDKIDARVRDGKMGFIGTHSCHFAKPFKRLMGTACS